MIRIPEDHKYAVIYIGAPFGVLEGGRLEYTSKTEKGATQWLQNHFGGSPMSLDCAVIDLDYASLPRYEPMTARDYYRQKK